MNNKNGTENSSGLLGRPGTFLLGFYLIAFAIMLIYLVTAIWPSELSSETDQSNTEFYLFGIQVKLNADIRLILLVMIIGALGSYIHVTKSFIEYVGNKQLLKSWVWSYILRPFYGMVLALIFYITFRGGLFSARADVKDINIYGVLAIAGLVGMFSEQAIEMLKELFSTIFKAKEEDKLKDKLNHVPNITTIEPLSIPVGNTEVTIKVNGNNFVEKSVVQINGSERKTDFVSTTQLTTLLFVSDISAPDVLEITVFNPPDGGLSNTVELEIK